MTEPTIRETLERHCKRYALGHREAALDDLEGFVRGSIAGCVHPGFCVPGNRSPHCCCACAVCKPRAPVMCALCSYPESAHGRNIYACGKFTPPEAESGRPPTPPGDPPAPP